MSRKIARTIRANASIIQAIAVDRPFQETSSNHDFQRRYALIKDEYARIMNLRGLLGHHWRGSIEALWCEDPEVGKKDVWRRGNIRPRVWHSAARGPIELSTEDFMRGLVGAPRTDERKCTARGCKSQKGLLGAEADLTSA
jgi:hypothetical protein